MRFFNVILYLQKAAAREAGRVDDLSDVVETDMSRLQAASMKYTQVLIEDEIDHFAPPVYLECELISNTPNLLNNKGNALKKYTVY